MQVNVLEVLDRPIAFQRAFVRIAGSINAALMLSQAVYWMKRTSDAGGWFWKNQLDWEDETGLTRREQDGARKLLRAKGLILEEKRGVPPKIYYRVDAERIGAELEAHRHQTAKLKAPLVRTKPPTASTKAPNCEHQSANLLITETTSKITAQRGTAAPDREFGFGVDDLGTAIPEDWQPRRYAKRVLEICNKPSSGRMLDECGQAIRRLAKKENLKLHEAAREMIARIRSADSRGEKVNSFWFGEDGGWERDRAAAPGNGLAFNAEFRERFRVADGGAD
jgi:hypothetical protein